MELAPEGSPTPDLHAAYEMSRPEKGNSQPLFNVLADLSMTGQVDIMGLHSDVAWFTARGELDILKSIAKRQPMGRQDKALVQLLGGTVVQSSAEDATVWVAAATPKQLVEEWQSADWTENQYRYWRFALSDVTYLASSGWPLNMGSRQMEVTERVMYEPLTRQERLARELRSNIYWFGNATGPQCQDNRRY